MGLGAAKATVGAITGAFVEAKLRSEEMARQVLDTSQALREIAAIKEKFAPDEAELAHRMRVRVGSGMAHEQAVGYQENLLNALGTVSKDKLSDKERENLEVEGAKFVARTSRNAATASAKAATLGMLPNFMKPAPGKELQATDVTNMGDAIDVILGRGMGSAETMATNYQDVLSAMTSEDEMKGFFRDPRQAAALTSIASGFDKGAPGTATLQAARQLRSFTKFRKKKGTTSAQTEALTKMGITEGDDPQQAMMKLFKYADENFKGEAFDAALQRMGFGDETGNKRLAQFYGQYKKGTFKELTDLAAAPIVPGAVDEKNAAFAKSKVGRDLISKAKIDAAKINRGAGGVDLTVEKQEAEAQLIEEGADDNPLNIIRRGVVGWFTGLGGEKSRVDVRDADITKRALENVRKRAGVDPAGGLGLTGMAANAFVDVAMSPIKPALPGLGGGFGTQMGLGSVAQNIFGFKENAEEVANLTKAVDKLTAAADAMNRRAQPGMQAQPPIGGAPNGQPLR